MPWHTYRGESEFGAPHAQGLTFGSYPAATREEALLVMRRDNGTDREEGYAPYWHGVVLVECFPETSA